MDKKLSTILEKIKDKKTQIDSFKPFSKNLTQNMEDWLKIELTYTSNAIEGNTLTRQETTLVVEDGISPGGKNIVEILEAQNHDKALSLVMDLSKSTKIGKISQDDILNIHDLILKGINDDNAGRYRSDNVRIVGSQTVMPNHMKVPVLMDELEQRLQNTDDESLMIACDLHYKFVRIHPFIDGNGRTGRLLFNLILLIAGYPISFIQMQDRSKYIDSLQALDTHGDNTDYYQIMLKSVERSLDLYLAQLQNTVQEKVGAEELFKIGELSKITGEQSATIRYRTKLGLLPVIRKGTGNYSYYDSRAIALSKQIRYLQKTKRLSLDEIRELLGNS